MKANTVKVYMEEGELPAFISYHDIAVAHQFIRYAVGRCILTDDEYERIKRRGLQTIPDDQQSPLRDITPSDDYYSYEQMTRNISYYLLLDYEKKMLRREQTEARMLAC